MSVAECQYPQSHATKRPLNEEIAAIAANRPLAASFYLDTKEEHSRPWPFEGKDHHQGLARTHRLQDGTVYLFLTHSEVGEGEQGQLMQFRYDGPLQGEHIAVSDPLLVAALVEQVYLHEPHPCDIQFLPDVNSADAGYLFVVEAFLTQRISVWAWAPETNLRHLGAIDQGFPQNQRPSFVFVDRDGDTVFLGVGWGNGEGRGFRAAARKLFPTCRVGEMDLLMCRRMSTWARRATRQRAAGMTVSRRLLAQAAAEIPILLQTAVHLSTPLNKQSTMRFRVARNSAVLPI